MRYLAAIVVAASTSGCMTIQNLRGQSDVNDGFPVPYGGTRINVQVLAAGTLVGAALINPKHDELRETYLLEPGFAALSALGLGTSVADLPLSLAADTLTLPYVAHVNAHADEDARRARVKEMRGDLAQYKYRSDGRSELLEELILDETDIVGNARDTRSTWNSDYVIR